MVYNQGTRGEGQNYFISFGYKPNDKHNFNFLITGAPQSHDQNFTKKISDYLTYGRKYNNNWGTLNGDYLSLRTNFYHKPVANLNWDFINVEIQEKVGTADVTQALVNTPSVYVAGQSGGYGDSRITVRGFQQDNTAFLLNGQPINGMEDGKMYWSNWSGMSDIANFIQVQRGLGSSKLAISSVGGTVNFVTRATDKKEGGFVSMGVANSDYFKSTAAYNTGIMKNGFGMSVMLSHWQGDALCCTAIFRHSVRDSFLD